HILPQGHEQLARQRNDGGLAAALSMRLEPARQRRLRLVSQPQPGELDHHTSQPRIAGLGHALLPLDAAAAPGRWRKSHISGKLAAVRKVPVKPPPTESGRNWGPLPSRPTASA